MATPRHREAHQRVPPDPSWSPRQVAPSEVRDRYAPDQHQPDQHQPVQHAPDQHSPDQHQPDQHAPDQLAQHRPATQAPNALSPAETVADLIRRARVDPGRRGVLALAVVGLVASLLAAAVLLRGRPSEVPIGPPDVVAGPSATTEVVVDVAGKVRRPGLVRLPAGARVDDAIRAAGGLLPGATTGLLNLAAKVSDGQQVLVGLASPAGPAGATGAGGGATGGTTGAGGLLDLNTATVQDLDALPGIGPVLAERIVAWRTERGRFASVDQLREVSGIGEAKYQQLKSKVQVG